MVDQNMLRRKIIQVHESMEMIAGYAHMTLEAFLKDKVAQNVVEYNLFIIINQMIDIASHIAVDEGYGSVDTLSDGFRLLHEKGFLSREDMDTYVKMVGFRNILAHQYIDMKREIVYDVMKNRMGDIDNFLRIIDENFL